MRTQLAEGLSHVRGDRVQLQQVLLNLIINAIEAMRDVGEEDRELLISTRNEPDGVCVEVRGSGAGFAPAARVVKSVNEHLRSRTGTSAAAIADHSAIPELVDRIDVHKDRLPIRLRSQENPGTINPADNNEPTDDRFLSIAWQKPPFKRFGIASWLLAKGGPAGAP